MLPQSKARIFPSGNRSETQSSTYRCYGTFAPRNLVPDKTRPFSSFAVLNDITLAGGESALVEEGNAYEFVFLPVVGTIHYETDQDSDLVNPGQALAISLGDGDHLRITNPYEDSLVSFLQLGFVKNKSDRNCNWSKLVPFDLDGNRNSFNEIETAFVHEREHRDSFRKISIGKFDGRAETQYPLSPGNGAFAYVIHGAFEVQYRLMETRDGLAVWEVSEVELEALSNEAVMLAIELPVDSV